jgi:putative transposase
MPNHIHLLIYSEKAADLPKFMQAVLQVYASFFRKVHHSSGFVFQNRYKSKLITNETYLLECARYIERNPLRAKLCQHVHEYSWSSFSHYATGSEDAIIEKNNPCFLNLSNVELTRQNYYREYIEENRPYQQIIDEYFRIS